MAFLRGTTSILAWMALVLLLWQAAPAQAQWNVERLTDDGYRDDAPRVSQEPSRNVAWRKKPSLQYDIYAIYFHDGLATRAISVVDQIEEPSISGSRVTWSRYFKAGQPQPDCSESGASCNNPDEVIFLFDGVGTQAITCRDGLDCDDDGGIEDDRDGRDHNPVIDGMNMAWIEGTYNHKVEYYNGSSVTRIDDTGGSGADISGSNVVWINGGVMLYTGSLPPDRLDTGTYSCGAPHVAGPIVVWNETIPQPVGGTDVVMYDGSSTTTIATGGVNGGPRCTETDVVFEMNGYVGLYNIAAASTVELGLYLARNPDVAGPLVVWAQGGGNEEIYVYDMRNGSTTRLTNNSYRDTYPVVSGGTIAWRGQAAGSGTSDNDWEIFKAVITGDLDNDADVDGDDLALFVDCMNGPGVEPQCDVDADFDNDGDVDLRDASELLLCFNGRDNPPACSW